MAGGAEARWDPLRVAMPMQMPVHGMPAGVYVNPYEVRPPTQPNPTPFLSFPLFLSLFLFSLESRVKCPLSVLCNCSCTSARIGVSRWLCATEPTSTLHPCNC